MVHLRTEKKVDEFFRTVAIPALTRPARPRLVLRSPNVDRRTGRRQNTTIRRFRCFQRRERRAACFSRGYGVISRGNTLAERLAEGPRPPREAARAACGSHRPNAGREPRWAQRCATRSKVSALRLVRFLIRGQIVSEKALETTNGAYRSRGHGR
jgi:hypothetical protein